jgi:cobalt-zinc-cadmium efflux system protein
MAHQHDHSHHNHPVQLSHINKAFVIGITLNLLFVAVEAITGFITNSLALLSDAGHNLSDVVSLALSLLAFKLAKIKPTSFYTYGYKKSTILVTLVNAVILLIAIGGIGYEAVHRLLEPEPLKGSTVAIVATIGIVINAVTAYLFFKDQEKDLNIKGAYLHMVADALVSLAVVAGGVIIAFTNWYWVDSVMSLLVAVVILRGTWGLLWDSLRLSLDGVPKDIKLEEVKKTALAVSGIVDIHHIHVWPISTTENAMTAHLVVQDELPGKKETSIRKKLLHDLEHLNIRHVTLEVERGTSNCVSSSC